MPMKKLTPTTPPIPGEAPVFFAPSGVPYWPGGAKVPGTVASQTGAVVGGNFQPAPVPIPQLQPPSSIVLLPPLVPGK